MLGLLYHNCDDLSDFEGYAPVAGRTYNISTDITLM